MGKKLKRIAAGIAEEIVSYPLDETGEFVAYKSGQWGIGIGVGCQDGDTVWFIVKTNRHILTPTEYFKQNGGRPKEEYKKYLLEMQDIIMAEILSNAPPYSGCSGDDICQFYV